MCVVGEHIYLQDVTTTGPGAPEEPPPGKRVRQPAEAKEQPKSGQKGGQAGPKGQSKGRKGKGQGNGNGGGKQPMMTGATSKGMAKPKPAAAGTEEATSSAQREVSCQSKLLNMQRINASQRIVKSCLMAQAMKEDPDLAEIREISAEIVKEVCASTEWFHVLELHGHRPRLRRNEPRKLRAQQRHHWAGSEHCVAV